MEAISWRDFEKVDLRVGTIVEVAEFPEAIRPAFKVWVDLGGELGVKKSSAQITDNYTPEQLIGKQVVCVVNFPEKQIGPFRSQILITGLADHDGKIVLTTVDKPVPNGSKLK